jgi:hypothetical protein
MQDFTRTISKSFSGLYFGRPWPEGVTPALPMTVRVAPCAAGSAVRDLVPLTPV